MPQLVVQQFSMEALHHTMLNNQSQILGMYDEMSIMYGQLDAYKHQGSRLDRSTLLDLYNGGAWSRTFKNRDQATCKMHRTSFNMCGFIQPSFVVEMLNRPDPDAFNDRQFFVCPEEVEYKYNQLKVPIDPSIPRLETVFRNIKLAHNSKVHYCFSEEAQIEFINVHDKLSQRKIAIKDDEDRRGILSKAKGQLARLAMVIQSLNESFMKSNDGDHLWEYKISKESLSQAKVILDYIIEEKFALMKPEIEIEEVQPTVKTGSQKLDNHPQYLSKFLSFKQRDIMASDVSKYRLMPPVQTDKKKQVPC